jgi:hypothetical protein
MTKKQEKFIGLEDLCGNAIMGFGTSYINNIVNMQGSLPCYLYTPTNKYCMGSNLVNINRFDSYCPSTKLMSKPLSNGGYRK